MDSLTFYDFNCEGKAPKAGAFPADSFPGDAAGYLSDLGPSSELSLDIADLLRHASGTPSDNPEQLFPDLLAVKPELDTPEFIHRDHMPQLLSDSTTTLSAAVQDSANASVAQGPALPEGLQSNQLVTISVPGQNTGTLLEIPVSMLPNDLNLVQVKEEDTSPVAQPTAVTPSTVTSSQVSSTTTSRPRTSFKAPSSAKRSSSNRRRAYDKESHEYKERRARNNVAVRKSRDKAKERQVATESKVQDLSDRNDELQKKVDLLTKELNVLRGLFGNIGAKLPSQYGQYIKNEN